MRPILILSVMTVACCTFTACRRPCKTEYHNSVCVVQESYIHKYGVEVPAEEWSARGEHGQVVSTLSNGVTVAKGYTGGTLDGETTYTFPHSESIEKVEFYTNGKLVRDTTYYVGGAQMQETHYDPTGGKGVTLWYENGTTKNMESFDGAGLLVQGQYYDNHNNLDSQVDNREGIRTTRDRYGQLLYKDTIEGSVMTSRITFHPNGTPSQITPYRNGIVEGDLKTFLPGGEPNTIQQWQDGKQQGTTTVFKHGEKHAEIPYVNGAKRGIESRYRDDGQDVVEEINWKDDKKHGSHATYIGDTEQVTWYYQGKPVSKQNYDRLTAPK